MTETPHAQEPQPVDAAPEEVDAVPLPEAPLEDGLIGGRPVEDRSFEVVEVGVGASLGLAIGGVVAGLIGAAAGAVFGGAAAFVAGEAIERAAGHAAETTDATH